MRAARCRDGARPRGTAGDGGADVDEVAVAAGARPRGRCWRKRWRSIRPRQLITERWTLHQLVGGAGPGGAAPQIEVGVHEPATLLSELADLPKALGVEQVERGDVERGGHGHFRTRLDQPSEVEACLSVVEASVDVGSRDVEQPLSTERPGGTHHLHGDSGTLTALTVEHGDVAVTEVGSHGGILVGHCMSRPQDGDDDFPLSGSQPLIFG